ncbi:MAG: FAD-dependent oxidoreductase [Ignavibacteria bacterium]|nr:FAD-dependent oxidoreductase [Ignavibacteria bacterium]
MDKQLVRLLKKEDVAEGTMMFTFEKPEGFVFKAGQAIDMTLVSPEGTDAEGNIRTFSLVSAPFEDFIAVATRMRDTAFKRTLKNMELNSEVEIESPFGSFTLHNDISKPAVFLVGGIGITPFFSIVKNASHEKLPHKIYLFYSNRRPEDSAFLKQFENLEKINPNFKLICTMSEMEKSKMQWSGEKGFISKNMIEKYVPDLKSPIYYSAGPQQMVAAMRKILSEIGVDDDFIRTEEFSGY